MFNSKQQALGFTLVELMISLVLGLILLLAAASVLVSSLTQLKNTGSFSEIVDNGRVAMTMMGKDVSHAGFMAELSGQNLMVGTNLTVQAGAVSGDCIGAGLNNATFPVNAATATFRMLWGETVSGTTALGCLSGVRSNTDLIQIKRLIGQDDTTAGLVDDSRVYLVTNSTGGILFNGDTGLVGAAPNNSQYYEYQHRIYYIENTSRYGESDFPVLVRETLKVVSGSETMVKEEVAEGVEDLRILYGIDDNGDGATDRYATAAQVVDDEWDQVDFARIISAQVSMLIRAIEPDASFKRAGSATYNYGGKRVTSEADGLRRKVLSSTFALRNYQIATGV